MNGALIVQLRQRSVEGREAAASGTAGQEGAERLDVEEIAALDSLQRRAQALGAEELGQVEQGAVQRRDRDPVDRRAVAGVEPAGGVAADPVDSVRSRCGDVDHARRSVSQLPQRRRRVVTQQ